MDFDISTHSSFKRAILCLFLFLFLEFKNYCEKHRLCVIQILEMQNNWFWLKTGLTLTLQILLLLIGNQCKKSKEN